MSKKSRRQELHKKILKIGAGIAILIAAVGVGAVVFWLQNQNRQTGTPQTDGSANPITGLEDRTPPVIKEAQDLATRGNIDESNRKLDEALKTAGSSSDKYNIYMQQGTNFANQKNYQKALETLRLANSQQQTAS